MGDQRDNEERLRETLLELTLLRERETSALRESNALLDGVARMAEAVTPTDALLDLLASARSSLDCEAAFVVAAAGSEARIITATDPSLAEAAMPTRIIAGKRRRRVADLARVSWWTDVPTGLIGCRSLLSTPIELEDGVPGAFVCVSETADHFTADDPTLLDRMATLSAQALAHAGLVKRNALLAAVIEGASASVAIADATDPLTPLIYVNQAFLDLSGFRREDVLGHNCRLLSAEPPDSPERTRLRKAVAERGSGTFELRNRKRDGTEFWNRLTLYPIAGEKGDAQYLVATQVDISAERAAADERDAAQQRLIGALSSTSEGFLLLDMYGRVLLANARYRSFYETESVTLDEGADFATANALRLIEEGVPSDEAYRRANKRRDDLFAGSRDREERLADGRTLLINDHATADGGAVSIATDITRLKATERSLAQRAVAIDTAQDGIAMTDKGGRFVYLNPSYLAEFGYTEEADLLGRHWSNLFRPEMANRISETGLRALEVEGTWRADVEGLTRSGEDVPLDVSITRLDDGGFVTVARDVSERQRNERERARMREQLQIAQRQEAIGQLAAGVAHDFNNVLSAISGSATLIALSGGEETHTDRIIKACERAAELVNRLLALGAREPNREQVDLCAPFAEAVDLLRTGLPARTTLIASAPDHPVVAMADSTDLLQIILNLGINARDAMPDGRGELRMELSESTLASMPDDIRVGRLELGQTYAIFSVSDSGTGISPEQIDAIFSPYFSTKGADGTGLGLAVVSSIVRAAGGAVGLSSVAGEGTEFRVYWPLDPEQSSFQQTRGLEPSGDQPDMQRHLVGATVLICDDSEPVSQVIAAILDNAGAETAVCNDPRDAYDAICEDPGAWSLLITDFDMPEMTGGDLAAAVRERVPTIPILLCTALSQHYRDGPPFYAVLPKPIEPDRLIALAGAAIISVERAEA